MLMTSALLMAGCDGQDDGLQPVSSASAIGFTATVGSSPDSLDDGSQTALSAVWQDRRRNPGSDCLLEVTASPWETALTRADGEAGLSDLKNGRGFGVFAAYTGVNRYGDTSVSSDFMYNQPVAWEGSAWSYTPVKYWPNGEGLGGSNTHYVSFFGYAPYSDLDGSDPSSNPAGYCISGFSQPHEKGDPWLTYRLIDESYLGSQVDLLCAKSLDMTRPEVDTPVELEFSHALSCVGDEITVETGSDMRNYLKSMVTGGVSSVMLRLTDVSVTYTLAEKGRLVLWNRSGVANWQPVLSENLTCERVPALTGSLPVTLYSYSGGSDSTDTWSDSGHGVFFIPLDESVINQKATINITYEVILNGSVVFATHDGVSEVSFGSQASPGRRVALKCIINKVS